MGINRDQVADRVGDFLDTVIRKDVERAPNPPPKRVPSFREFVEDEEAAERKRDAERQVARDIRRRLNGRPDTVTVHPSEAD